MNVHNLILPLSSVLVSQYFNESELKQQLRSAFFVKLSVRKCNEKMWDDSSRNKILMGSFSTNEPLYSMSIWIQSRIQIVAVLLLVINYKEKKNRCFRLVMNIAGIQKARFIMHWSVRCKELLTLINSIMWGTKCCKLEWQVKIDAQMLKF